MSECVNVTEGKPKTMVSDEFLPELWSLSKEELIDVLWGLCFVVAGLKNGGKGAWGEDAIREFRREREVRKRALDACKKPAILIAEEGRDAECPSKRPR